MKRDRMTLVTTVVALLLLLTFGAPSASADTFTFTSCHITGSACLGGNVPSGFGTVTLTANATGGVDFSVVLTNGNRFVETGAGGGSLFVFNDSVSGSTVTGAYTTLNGVTTSLAVSGLTNQPAIMADGTGTFTAQVFCTTASDCNGGSTPNINDLHFTVTNATLAQLETANALGNIFVADILCGATQTGCAGGLTGDVDVNTGAVPDGGMTLMLLGGALVGIETLRRKFRV